MDKVRLRAGVQEGSARELYLIVGTDQEADFEMRSAEQYYGVGRGLLVAVHTVIFFFIRPSQIGFTMRLPGFLHDVFWLWKVGGLYARSWKLSGAGGVSSLSHQPE